MIMMGRDGDHIDQVCVALTHCSSMHAMRSGRDTRQAVATETEGAHSFALVQSKYDRRRDVRSHGEPLVELEMRNA
jgi:hypothetical protein